MNYVVTEPGIYDIPEDVYHRDPVPGGSLSSSGARKLLPPSCPAKYAWERAKPPAPSEAMELGTAAHRMVLGTGQPIACVEAKDWRTAKARETAEAIRADGGVPLLAADYERVKEMAAALRTHPLASALLCRDDVRAEQSFFWQDPEFGIWRRARLDSLRQAGQGSRLLITDYKTALCAEPEAFAKSCANYGYHMQAAWYLDAVGEPAAFLFVAQEKTPPYLVTVCELDGGAIRAGDAANRRAMEIYRDCTETGLWPGYQPDNDIALISLPAWARAREDYL